MIILVGRTSSSSSISNNMATIVKRNNKHDFKWPLKWPKSNQRTRFKPLNYQSKNNNTLIYILLLIIFSKMCSVQTTLSSYSSSSPSSSSPPLKFQLVDRSSSTQPSAQLPKFGLVKGLKFVVRSNFLNDNSRNDNDRSSASNETELKVLFMKRNTVAAFLGIPYAAPPTRSLRFMPPGAVKAQQLAAASLEQCQSGQRTLATRPFTTFGPECVRLSDWLDEENNSAKLKPANYHDQHQNLNLNQNNAGEPKQNGRLNSRSRQDENCLNLNVFVPLDQLNQISSNVNATNEGAGARSFATNNNNYRPTTSSPAELNESSQQTTKDHHLIKSINSSSPAPVSRDEQRPWRDNPQANQSGSRTAYREPRLAVLLVFHSAPNSLDHLRLAHLSQSLVVTFNHRTGLLGYLPFADQHQPDGQLGGASVRFNHAIWDQLGALHWLRHNVAHFNGDPNNVTLLAADPQAVQAVHLLALSPLAKDLFKRVVIVHNNNRIGQPTSFVDMDELIKAGQEWRQSTRPLIDELTSIVRTHKQVAAEEQLHVFEQIKAANLSELASIERQLGRNLPAKYLTLVGAPQLNDRLLFPYLSGLFQPSQGGQLPSSLEAIFFGQPQRDNNRTGASMRMELDYCLYMRQLELKVNSVEADSVQNITNLLLDFDPIGLIPRIYSSQQQVNSTSWPAASHSSHQNKSEANLASAMLGHWRPDVRSMAAGALRSRRATIAGEFHHLRHAQMLNSLLVRRPQQQRHQKVQQQDEEDEEQDETDRKQQQRSMQILASESAISTRLRRGSSIQNDDDDYLEPPVSGAGLQAEQLAELLASFDLMLGFVGRPIKPPVSAARQAPADHKASNFNEIVKALNGIQNGQQLDEGLLFLMRLADLHFVAALGADESLFLGSQFCDFQSAKASKSFHQPGGATAANTRHQLIPLNTAKATRMFVRLEEDQVGEVNMQDEHAFNLDWLLESGELLDVFNNFVRFGGQQQQQQADVEWPAYDSLNRNVRLFNRQHPSRWTLANEDENFRHIAQIQLDLAPYLEQLASQTSSSLAGHQSSSKQARQEPVELINCLVDIEFALKSLSPNWQQLQQQRTSSSSAAAAGVRWAPTAAADVSWNSLARFNEEAQCLVNVSIHLRNQVRSLGSSDLEPMLRRLNLVVSTASQSRQLALIERSSSFSLTKDPRNLVNTTSKPEDEDDPSDRQLVSSPISPTTASTSPSTAHSQSSSWLSGNNLLAKAYRDPVGQALSVIIGAGFFVFLINLLIVLIVLRSARRNRQRNGDPDRSDGQQRLESKPSGAGGHQDELESIMCTPDYQPGHLHLMVDHPEQASEAPPQPPALTSSFKTSSPPVHTSFKTSRSIKFDLTGTSEGRRSPDGGAGSVEEDQPRKVNYLLANTVDEGSWQKLDQQRVSLAGAGLVLDPTEMLGKYQDDAEDGPDEDLLFQNGPMCQHHRQQQQQQHHHHQQHFHQNSLASPFNSQSTTSSSTAIKSQHWPHNASTNLIYLPQEAHHNHHYHHHQHAHSIASPSSSTTLSTTPIPQLPSATGASNQLIGFAVYQPMEELQAGQAAGLQDLRPVASAVGGKVFPEQQIYYLHHQEHSN